MDGPSQLIDRLHCAVDSPTRLPGRRRGRGTVEEKRWRSARRSTRAVPRRQRPDTRAVQRPGNSWPSRPRSGAGDAPSRPAPPISRADMQARRRGHLIRRTTRWACLDRGRLYRAVDESPLPATDADHAPDAIGAPSAARAAHHGHSSTMIVDHSRPSPTRRPRLLPQAPAEDDDSAIA